MISGLNHLTISVSNLDRSFSFYTDVLGVKAVGRWDEGAYLLAGNLWICLSLGTASPANDYTHYAFNVDENHLDEAITKLIDAEATCWKNNTSEGTSYYFLDPDGHKLELHSGSLSSRLESLRLKPYAGWKYLG